MRLATIRTRGGTRAVRVEGEEYVELNAGDVGELLAYPDAGARALGAGVTGAWAGADLAPVIPRPGKTFCVGLNYRNHILEMGRELPAHPTLFAKFSDALIGARDDISLAPESSAVDWEAELCVVIGREVRRASDEQAVQAIAGFTAMNDVTMRDWQFRTKEWLQGKTFEGTTPLGPVLVTPDELEGGTSPRLNLASLVDGETMQQANTSDLVFGPAALVCYISTITTLRPGDIIATGTPGGVGYARNPATYLSNGQTLVTEISGIGRLENVARTS